MIRRWTILCVLVVFASIPAAAAEYRTFSELLDAMLDAQQRSAEGVSDYALDITVMNHPTTQYFERTPLEASGGRSLDMFRPVQLDEVQRRLKNTPGRAKGDGSRSALERGIADAGLPKGLSGMMDSTAGAGPWASAAPGGLINSIATVSEGADGAAGSASERESMERFLQNAKIVGREKLDGRNAYLVRADNLNVKQVTDGEEMIIDSIALWVDTEQLVMLKMHMDGTMKQDGQSRDIFLEKVDHDYRTVPGSRMLIPYRSVMRMGGVLGPKEQREMEDASKQLAELDSQLAAMPPSQRQMFERTAGPQIEMMRKMVAGGAFEVETTVREVRINQGIEAAFAGATTGGSPEQGIGAIAAAFTQATATATAPATEPEKPAPPARDAAALQKAREECIEQKVAEAQARQQKKKRFGNLVGAVGRIAGRHGGGEITSEIKRVSSTIYDANATADDLTTAADALGISRDELAACDNPD